MSPGSGNSTLEFLRSIWPEGHTYCIAVKPPGKGAMRQAFFTSIEQAAGFAEVAALRQLEVYHACAVFLSDKNRKGENAAGAQAFWLDIDVGPTKPYQDERSALAALLTFSQTVGLPTPSIVHSGGGWHAYWPLDTLLPPPVWQAFAERLRAACNAHGLHADPAITIDIARILRPPGTTNFKREKPVPVEWRHAATPISPRVIAAALQTPTPQAIPAHIAALGADNSKFEVHTTAKEEPSYATKIVSGCKQLAYLRDSGGRVDEPFWYAALCLLAACEDGEPLAHEWSKGDERYSYADTAKKLEQGRRNSGPTTCDKFQSLNPGGCAGCPHYGRITSPIQIGRTGAQAEKVTVVGDITCPTPPSPFRRAASGALQLLTRDENDQPVTVTVYKAPLFLESIREHEMTGIMTLNLKHWLPHEGWLDATVPWADRSQKAVINSLGSQKINVPRSRERDILTFLEASIDDFQSNRKTEMEFAQFGWREGFSQFLLGNELYSVGSQKGVAVGLTQELTHRAKQMKVYGTFEAWRSAAQPLFVHPQQGIMVVAGFASVLMRFVQELTGVIVAAVSSEPRLGKTMGLVAARSIWGDDNAIDIATNDTANSRFRMLAVLNGLPATWDDMRKSNDPEIIKQFVLSFSQGRDKNRLEKSGALRSNTSGWASILLATSNISIAELVGHDGETAQQARILEYRFEPMPGMKFSDGQQYERVMRQNRGQAGRRFIQALMLPGMVPWVQAAVPQYVRDYEKELGRSDASFYASFLGCLKAAAEILNRAGILEFSSERLMEFAVTRALDMGKLMQENASDPAEVLTRFIHDNWANALVVMDTWKPKQEATARKMPIGKLHIRYEINPQRVFIDKTAFKEWCRPKNIMFRDVVDRLDKEGVSLNSMRRINLGAGTALSGAGQSVALEIDTGHPAMGGIKEVLSEHPLPTTNVPTQAATPLGVTPIRKRTLIPGKIQDAQRQQ